MGFQERAIPKRNLDALRGPPQCARCGRRRQHVLLDQAGIELRDFASPHHDLGCEFGHIPKNRPRIFCRLQLCCVQYASVTRLLFVIGRLYLTRCAVRWGSKNRHHEDTSECLIDFTYSTFDGEHSWEDLHIQLRNQQTCTSDSYNYIRGGSIRNPIFVDASL